MSDDCGAGRIEGSREREEGVGRERIFFGFAGWPGAISPAGGQLGFCLAYLQNVCFESEVSSAIVVPSTESRSFFSIFWVAVKFSCVFDGSL